ncbi:MAG TPA: hypothetical protein VLT84_10720 [Acidobacteriota bacterium]|nr:hypothetical protein [Acidobacteriota bacterium]
MEPRRLLEEQAFEAEQSDPSGSLFTPEEGTRTILLGEYGFGKTTCLLRGLNGSPRVVVFLAAARLPNDSLTTAALLSTGQVLNELGNEYPEDVRPAALRLGRHVLGYMLRRPEFPIAVIVDGLDESVPINRPGGLHRFIGSLHEVAVPLVVSARSEWWAARAVELRTPIDTSPRNSAPPQYRWNVVELLPWMDTQIEELADRFRSTLDDPDARARIADFVQLVRSHSYDAVYGDIPRRPLFLRCILELLVEGPILRSRRVELFQQWVQFKIYRDFVAPLEKGGPARPGIRTVEEQYEQRVSLALLAMEAAAGLMVTVEGSTMVLLPMCTLRALARACPELGAVPDSAGLVSNSLLRVEAPAQGVEGVRLGFSHRAYQEYFLARWLLRNEAPQLSGIRPPAAVVEWLDRMRAAEG